MIVWKRRYEKERDKNTKMKAIIAKLEAELQAWRSGKLLYTRDPGRYEKERDKDTQMKAIIAKLEAELQAWRSGKLLNTSDPIGSIIPQLLECQTL